MYPDGRKDCTFEYIHACQEWYDAKVKTASSDEVIFEDFAHSFPKIAVVRIVQTLDTNYNETGNAQQAV